MNREDKILLINCPFGFYGSPDLGLARVASFLKNHGVEVAVRDLNLELYEESGRPELWNRRYHYSNPERFAAEFPRFESFFRRTCAAILATGYRLFGFNVHLFNLLYVNRLAAELDRNLGAKIILGGGAVALADTRERLYRSCNVSLVKGRGESVLRALLADRARGKLRPLYRDDDPGSDPEADFVTAFDAFDLDRYPGRNYPLIFTEGCNRRCVYCSEPFYKAPCRARDAAMVRREIEAALARRPDTFFEFHDLAINLFPDSLLALCRELSDRDWQPRWCANAIPDRFFTTEHCARLARGGCVYLRFGLESGSPETVRRMRKAFQLDDARTALRRCAASGIKTGVNLIVGFPGETEADFAQTLAFLKENKDSIGLVDNLFTCYITGGSDLEHRAVEWGIVRPENDPWYRWYTVDPPNDFALRRARQERLLAFCRAEGIAVGTPDAELNTQLMDWREAEAAEPSPAISPADRRSAIMELARNDEASADPVPDWDAPWPDNMAVVNYTKGFLLPELCPPGEAVSSARRPIPAVLDEIAAALAHGIRHFYFSDEAINQDLPALAGLCEHLIARRWDLRWWARLAAREAQDGRLFALLRRAGCVGVDYLFTPAAGRDDPPGFAPPDVETAARQIRDLSDAGLWVVWRTTADPAGLKSLGAEADLVVMERAASEDAPRLLYEPSDRAIINRVVTQPRRRPQLIVEAANGRLHFYRDGTALLGPAGFFLDWDLAGQRYLSFDAAWKPAPDLTLRTESPASFEFRLTLHFANDELLLELRGAAKMETVLTRLKINLLFNPATLRCLQSGPDDFPLKNFRDAAADWHPVGPLDRNGRPALSENFQWNAPCRWSLVHEPTATRADFSMESPGWKPVAQARCRPGAAVCFYRDDRLTIGPVPQVLGRLKIAARDARTGATLPVRLTDFARRNWNSPRSGLFD
ncbi:MAG: radical SAM protein [Myxococcales bacterium]|nr:radical SAM protein [Myxococcales bacterium]